MDGSDKENDFRSLNANREDGHSRTFVEMDHTWTIGEPG